MRLVPSCIYNRLLVACKLRNNVRNWLPEWLERMHAPRSVQRMAQPYLKQTRKYLLVISCIKLESSSVKVWRENRLFLTVFWTKWKLHNCSGGSCRGALPRAALLVKFHKIIIIDISPDNYWINNIGLLKLLKLSKFLKKLYSQK